jgi:TnpA family transposase
VVLEDQLGGLGIVSNCRALWNTRYVDDALILLRQQGCPVLEAIAEPG